MGPFPPFGSVRRGNLINRLFAYLAQLPPSDRTFLKLSILAVFVFAIWLAISFSISTQVQVSASGGTLKEGIIGTPRFVNPVLAVTQADKDMSALVYDGLMKLGPDGTLIPNVAKSVTVSNDGLTYDVALKDNVRFQDGTLLTASDVVFTVKKMQDATLVSPLRPNFQDIHVEQVGDHELNFILPEPYAPFIENLTFGILPEHIWKDATDEEFPFSQHNSEPVGSGPYEVKNIIRNTSGVPEQYILTPNPDYHDGAPKISRIELHFFTNEAKIVQALNDGTINSTAALDESYLNQITAPPNTYKIITIPLPRTFAVFFNENKSPALRNLGARKALNAAIDRKDLVNTVLNGYADPLYSPIPPGFGIDSPAPSSTDEINLETAKSILQDSGWTLNDETGIWEKKIDGTDTPLSFSISTANNKVFDDTAEYLRNQWAKLGAAVTVKQFEQADLTQSVIRPRDYESLLFGTVVGRALDFYSFWHSSQRNDPGLNIALYANITTDALLSKERSTRDQNERNTALLQFADEINKEVPAIFLYSPQMLYVFPANITGATFQGVAEPYERFASISNWYIDTEDIWPLLNKRQNK
jgi:peptide/nickel transport system substrate-binding protein